MNDVRSVSGFTHGRQGWLKSALGIMATVVIGSLLAGTAMRTSAAETLQDRPEKSSVPTQSVAPPGSHQEIRTLRYEMMRPGEIQDAVKKGLPLLIPVGVLEYHGPQNPVGTDALISQGIAHCVAKEVECVVAPTLFYGFTGQWAGGIDKGEIHVEGGPLYGYVKPILKAFYEQGWRRIYVICHHQGPKGVTMLSYQRAATEAAMEHGLANGGVGWSESRALYPNVFSRIAVVGDSEFSAQGYGGHGGNDETSAMMYFCPDTVDLGELAKRKPESWAADAHKATAQHGEKIAKAIVASWKRELTKDPHR